VRREVQTITLQNGTFNNVGVNNSIAQTGNMIVNNILNVASGYALTIGSYTLTLNGTITGSGTLTGSSSSNLSVLGSSSGVGTLSFTSGSQTLNTLTLNRSGVGQNAAALLGTNLSVSNLTLTNGIIGTNHKLLTYDRTGAYTAPATYTDSYICTCTADSVTDATNGSQGFKINNIGGTNTNIVFPVSSDYKSPNRMMINNFNGSANDFTVVVGKGDIGNTPNARVNRIWYVNATNAGSGNKATMQLYFTKRDPTNYPLSEDEVETAFDYTDIHLVQENNSNLFLNISNGADKQNFIGSANGTEIYGLYSYGVSPDYLNATQGINTFTRFSVINSAGYILPVNIIGYKAWQQGTAVQLAWTALNEIDIDHYEVERSADARVFTMLGNIAAKNTGSSADYNFADQKPNTGNNYYRIKVFDKNGAIYYTQIINVPINANGGAAITIYPNPVSNGRFTLQMTNMAAAKYNLLIYDAKGRLVFSKTIEHTGGSASQSIDLPAGIAAGVYQVNVISNNYNSIKKLVIK
ncbi:MAG: T9SS type A sorting domain-containing protein, partial [Parafilimonas sp.]